MSTTMAEIVPLNNSGPYKIKNGFFDSYIKEKHKMNILEKILEMDSQSLNFPI